MNTKIETLIAEWTEELHTFTHDDADKYIDLVNRTIAALRQADQQAQPVAKIEKGAGGYYDIEDLPGTEELLPVGVHMLYLHPPAQPQVREETVTGKMIDAALCTYDSVATNQCDPYAIADALRSGIAAAPAMRQPQAEGMVTDEMIDAGEKLYYAPPDNYADNEHGARELLKAIFLAMSAARA